MAILDKLKSWRLRVTVILLFVLLSLYSLLGLTSERKPTIGKRPTVKSQQFVPSSPVTSEKVPQFVPPSPVTPELEHTPEKPPAKLQQFVNAPPVTTTPQADYYCPPEYLNEYLKKHGLLLDNRDTCSAPAKHAYTLTGQAIIQAIIIATVFLLVVLFPKLTCYIKNKMEKICKPFSYINVASELAPTFKIRHARQIDQVKNKI